MTSKWSSRTCRQKKEKSQERENMELPKDCPAVTVRNPIRSLLRDEREETKTATHEEARDEM